MNYGFCGQISAHAASEALKIHKGFPAASSLPDRKSASQKLFDLKGDDFREIFGAKDAALLAQGKDDKPKSTEKGAFQAWFKSAPSGCPACLQGAVLSSVTKPRVAA